MHRRTRSIERPFRYSDAVVSHRIAEYQDISISEYCIAEYQNIVSHRIAEYQGGGPSSVVGFVARMRREEVLAATS